MEGYRLDPDDWGDFGTQMHDLLDQCLNRMTRYRDLPWAEPQDMNVGLDGNASALPDVFDTLTHTIMPNATGNTHPAFWGWVHGTGLPAALGAEIVAATMNSNCGGRHHGATQVESAVIDWLTQTAGLPNGASGILTGGTSQATILALSIARFRLFGSEIRKSGIRNLPAIAVYGSEAAHSCVARALEIMGHGRDAFIPIPTDATGAIALDSLSETLARDKARGIVPLAIVGTAGSVGVGAFDALNDLASLASDHDIWLHIDAAFGYWTRLADAPWRSLSKGIGRADSIALDTHKWPGVQYDCGACLVADGDLHRATFATRPAYLQSAADGLAGGDLWYTDYGMDLSRGFKALKVWTSLKIYGADRLGAAISDNCRQAALMGELAEASPKLRLAHPVISNVCCFEPLGKTAPEIAATLQIEGQAVFSTIEIDGASCLRAAIVNHRTTSDTVRHAIQAVESLLP